MALPLVLPPGGALLFPDPRRADDEGLLAIGGDLSAERLLFAYDQGIFPWYDAGMPPLWWSPDPRTVLEADETHISRSLRRRLRHRDFTLTWNCAFADVMRACADERPRGTWILPELVVAYVELHRRGYAHSLEVWMDGELAGGLYGVQRGAFFAAESMFHRKTDASKIALVVAVKSLFAMGIELFDVQFMTPHLASLGARSLRRAEYLDRLAEASRKSVDLRGLDLNIGLEAASHGSHFR